MVLSFYKVPCQALNSFPDPADSGFCRQLFQITSQILWQIFFCSQTMPMGIFRATHTVDVFSGKSPVCFQIKKVTSAYMF